MREVTLEAPFDVPQNRFDTVHLRMFLESLRAQVGQWGSTGRDVGVGFTWYTNKGIDNNRLHLVVKRVKRAFKASKVVDQRCDPYNLEQRIVYIRDGDPHGTLNLKEG